jgi:hypothetical protein
MHQYLLTKWQACRNCKYRNFREKKKIWVNVHYPTSFSEDFISYETAGETMQFNYTWVTFKENFTNAHKFEHNLLPVSQPIAGIDIRNWVNIQQNMNQ